MFWRATTTYRKAQTVMPYDIFSACPEAAGSQELLLRCE